MPWLHGTNECKRATQAGRLPGGSASKCPPSKVSSPLEQCLESRLASKTRSHNFPAPVVELLTPPHQDTTRSSRTLASEVADEPKDEEEPLHGQQKPQRLQQLLPRQLSAPREHSESQLERGRKRLRSMQAALAAKSAAGQVIDSQQWPDDAKPVSSMDASDVVDLATPPESHTSFNEQQEQQTRLRPPQSEAALLTAQKADSAAQFLQSQAVAHQQLQEHHGHGKEILQQPGCTARSQQSYSWLQFDSLPSPDMLGSKRVTQPGTEQVHVYADEQSRPFPAAISPGSPAASSSWHKRPDGIHSGFTRACPSPPVV